MWNEKAAKKVIEEVEQADALTDFILKLREDVKFQEQDELEDPYIQILLNSNLHSFNTHLGQNGKVKLQVFHQNLFP